MTSENHVLPARDWLRVAVLVAAIVGITNLPYILAYCSPPSHVFGGILFQHGDGYSYLAKMREGLRGELFTLPYTAEPGAATLLFGYHLALGHLVRWSGASVEFIYHLARVLTSVLFLVISYRFIARFVSDSRATLLAWLMFVGSSGLGWAAMAFGRTTSDRWVAEAFPFLTLASNAHFPLTWACFLWLLVNTLPGLAPPVSAGGLALVALVVTIQAQVQPLALISVALLLGGMAIGRWVTTRRFESDAWARLVVITAAASPWFLHAFLVTRSHPMLAAWRMQGSELTPPWWNLLVSGGPLLALAVPGFVIALGRRTAKDQILVYWAVIGIFSLYLPGGFQRRLSLGLWMPIALLAFMALRERVWPRLPAQWRPVFLAGLVSSITLTNVLLYASTLIAVRNHNPLVFLTEDEAGTLDWLAQRPDRPLVLASPDLSMFIPARTDARVIYGHPNETVHGPARRKSVELFFTGQAALGTALPDDAIEYIVYGPREKALGHPDFTDWKSVFEHGDVTVYGR